MLNHCHTYLGKYIFPFLRAKTAKIGRDVMSSNLTSALASRHTRDTSRSEKSCWDQSVYWMFWKDKKTSLHPVSVWGGTAIDAAMFMECDKVPALFRLLPLNTLLFMETDISHGTAYYSIRKLRTIYHSFKYLLIAKSVISCFYSTVDELRAIGIGYLKTIGHKYTQPKCSSFMLRKRVHRVSDVAAAVQTSFTLVQSKKAKFK